MARTIAAEPGTVYAASEGDKFNAETTLEVVQCPTCSITYAIPAKLVRSARKWRGDMANGWKLCCPLGHTWWYVGETEAERLERQLEWARDRAGRLASQLDQTAAQLRGTKAAKTRIKNDRDRLKQRATAGVCPHPECHRHFSNLERHVATKHPELLEQLHHDVREEA